MSTSPTSAAPLDPTKAEEFRLHEKIQQNPPEKPEHGVFLLGPDGKPVGKRTPTSSLWCRAANPSLAPAKPMRIWDPRGIIDPIYQSQRNQQAAAQKVDKIHKGLRQKLEAIAEKDNGVTDDIKILISKLQDEVKQLNRMIITINYHWINIEDDIIGREYGYEFEEVA